MDKYLVKNWTNKKSTTDLSCRILDLSCASDLRDCLLSTGSEFSEEQLQTLKMWCENSLYYDTFAETVRLQLLADREKKTMAVDRQSRVEYV